jgi:hypothetical protein
MQYQSRIVIGCGYASGSHFGETSTMLPEPGDPPESFPAGRSEGGFLAASGRRFVLRVGPSSVALEGRRHADRWLTDVAHHHFLHPTVKPDLVLEVLYRPTGSPSGMREFQIGEVASFYRDGASWTIRLGEDDSSGRADRAVSLDASGKTGTLVIDPGQPPELAAAYPLEHPLENLLFRHLLADHGALLVHACGVAWHERGYLFVGSSGAGKSTAARLWKAAGATVLNDDRVVLEASRDGIFIHSTPWFGEYPEVTGERAPLAALYLIRKGDEVSFEPLRPAAAAALLFAKSFPPLWDPDRMGRTLEALEVVCRSLPCGWLTVPPDQRAVAWVQSRL